MVLFGVLVVLCGFLFTRMPGSFLPEEDQGYAIALVSCRRVRRCNRTNDVLDEDARRRSQKVDGFDGIMQVSPASASSARARTSAWRSSSSSRGTNATSPPRSSSRRPNSALFPIRDAQIFVINLPTVQGLGQFGGFDMYLQDRRARAATP